jgi:hypothetical protein
MWLNVYYYNRLPYLTKGLIEEKISYIYNSSDMNCMIWSEAYSKKTMDAIVTMQINTIYERHVKGSEREKLFTCGIFLKSEFCGEKASYGVRQPKTLRGRLLILAAILSSCFWASLSKGVFRQVLSE